MKVHVTGDGSFTRGRRILPEVFAKQKEIFYNVVHTCLKDSNCIGFMTWGIADRYSFLRNAEDLPNAKQTLFDDSYGKKAAYYGVLQALKEGR